MSHRRWWCGPATFDVWEVQTCFSLDTDIRYDRADGFVVLAQTEEQAREICSTWGGDEIHNTPDYWTNAQYSMCKKIGVSWEKEARQVLRDFHDD